MMQSPPSPPSKAPCAPSCRGREIFLSQELPAVTLGQGQLETLAMPWLTESAELPCEVGDAVVIKQTRKRRHGEVKELGSYSDTIKLNPSPTEQIQQPSMLRNRKRDKENTAQRPS